MSLSFQCLGMPKIQKNSQNTQYEHLLDRSAYWKCVIMTSTQKEAKRNPDKLTAILRIYFYHLWPGSALLSAILNGGFSHSAKFYKNLNSQEELMKLLTLKNANVDLYEAIKGENKEGFSLTTSRVSLK